MSILIKPKGTILKDSFYKERLSKTSNHIIMGYTTQFPSQPDAIESDTDAVVITPEYYSLEVGSSSWISVSICPILAKQVAELLLLIEISYVPTNDCLLYM